MSAVSPSSTGRSLSGVTGTCRLHGNLTSYGPRHTDHLGFHHLAWNTVCFGDHLGFANLTAGGVRNLAGPNFLGHRASGVRNLLGDRFAGPRAGRVRHLLGDRLLLVADAGVWDLLHAGDRDSAADRVGLLAVTNFLHHPSAAYRSHFGARHPPSAANRASRLAAAGAGGRATRVAGRGA